MRTLIIDRMEGIYAICNDKAQKDKQKFFGIQLSELPQGAAVGDTLEVDDETGTLTLVKSANGKKE
jgi:hypothetical protein